MLAYLDNSATTRVCKQAADKMYEVLTQQYGNPSSLHTMGFQADEILEESRSALARMLGCSGEEVFFTSGGTESNNMAIFGVTEHGGKRGGVITSAVEHPSVEQPVRVLGDSGGDVFFAPVDRGGRIDPAATVHGGEKDIAATVPEHPDRLLHTRVLHSGRNHAAPFAAVLRHAENRHIVALRAAGGEKHLFTGAAEHPRQRTARLLQNLVGLKAHRVQGGRIPVLLREDLVHFIRRLLADARCGAVVQICEHARSLL